MLTEAADIMMEVRRRKRDGLSFERLDAIKKFEWAVHETQESPPVRKQR